MNITRTELQDAAAQGLLQPEQVEPLYQFLHASQDPDTRFNLTNTLYYLGGFLAIGALSLFMNLGWERFGGWGILALCGLYAVGALALTELFRSRQLVLPAALSTVFIIVLVPLAVYGLQLAMGWWGATETYRDYHRLIHPLWLWMELATLLVGALLLWRYRYPLLVMPLAVTLWYLSLDLAEWLTVSDPEFSAQARLTMWFGLVILAGAFWVDLRSTHRYDYAWWLYAAGVLAFWGGLTAQNSDSELAKLGYCGINLLMMWLGIVLQRRVFMLFGAMGVLFYLGHLFWTVFEDSWWFPVVLTLVGLLVVWLGVLWQRNETQITAHLQAALPLKIRKLLERHRI